MLHRWSVLSVVAFAWMLAPQFARAAEPGAKRPPNIIMILADDLGFSDLSLHGSHDFKTPNIDSFASTGVRCINGYVSGPVCAPTRAGLLTGRYQERFGFEFNPSPGAAADKDGLPLNEFTLPSQLKKSGYATGMVGKWHLGGIPGMRPTERGFDEFFGFLEGAHAYIYPTDPKLLADLTKPIPFSRGTIRGTTPTPEPMYLTDAFTREAVAFIDRHKDQPFFLYLPYNAVHSPLQTTPSYLARVAGVGHVRRQIYGGMLTALDDGVGAVLSKLKDAGLEEQTLIFFFSDNGGSPQPYNTTDNRPFSGKKGELLEGGIHVPFFVRWKGTLPAGKVYENPVISLDVFATATAAAGGTLPSDRLIDSVNLLPFLTGTDNNAPHPALYWRYGEALASRQGNWKLHKSKDFPAQLYDLSADVGETTNVAAKHADRVKVMEAGLAQWNSQLKEPMWPPQAPHEKNMDWLYDVLGDPRMVPPETHRDE